MSVSCECCVFSGASGRSLVQRDPTECGVTVCDCEASIMRKPWPSRGCYAMEKIYIYICLFTFRSFRSNVECLPLIWSAHTNSCDIPSLKTCALSGFCIFLITEN